MNDLCYGYKKKPSTLRDLMTRGPVPSAFAPILLRIGKKEPTAIIP